MSGGEGRGGCEYDLVRDFNGISELFNTALGKISYITGSLEIP